MICGGLYVTFWIQLRESHDYSESFTQFEGLRTALIYLEDLESLDEFELITQN